MDIDATFLEPGSSLTPGCFRSLATSQHFVSLSFIQEIILHEFDRFLTHSDLPAWKRLINSTLPTPECISLIVSIFSDRNEVEIVGHLCGDDAQSFVDAIDGVCLHSSTSKERVS